MSMKANLSFMYHSMGFKINGKFIPLHLTTRNGHILLPFEVSLKNDDPRDQVGTVSSYYSTPTIQENAFVFYTSPGCVKKDLRARVYLAPVPANDKTHEYSIGDVRKVHLHLKHATKSQLVEHFKTAGTWSASLNNLIEAVTNSCACRLAKGPGPHNFVGT